MDVTLLFAPGTDRTPTTSDIFVDGFDVYEVRGDLRGTRVAFRTDGYPGNGRSEITRTGDLKKRTTVGKDAVPREGFVVDDDGSWLAGGNDALYRSRDRGKSWKREPVRAGDQQIVSLVRHGGKLFVAGMDGYLAVRDGKGWKSIERPKAVRVPFSKFGTSLPYPVVTLTRLVSTGDALFVLGNGLWEIDAKTAKATLVSESKNLLIALAKTSTGTLIAVGTNGAILRKEGKTWKSGSAGKDPLVGVVPIGDRVMVASTKAISLSADDGKSFKPIVKQPKLNHDQARYNVAIPDGQGGAIVAGWRGLLVRVSEDGLGAWASAKRPKADMGAKPAPKGPPSAHAKPKAKNAKEESKFLTAIIEAPEDDGPRLIYADWLTEHGDPRGELIQLQCLLKREVVGATTFNAMPIDDPHPDHLALGRREGELLKKHAKDWLAPIRKFVYQWSWQRGFLGRVTGNAKVLPGLKEILRTHPVALLELTGLKKADFAALAKVDFGPVRSLNLTQNRLGEKDVAVLCGANLAKVESLFLSANALGDAGVTMLATKSHLKKLRHLSLYDCDFGDDGLLAIARSPIFANLEVLGIGKCEATPAGIQALAESKTLKKLQHVAWSPMDFKRADFKKPIAALKKKLVPGFDPKRRWDPYTT